MLSSLSANGFDIALMGINSQTPQPVASTQQNQAVAQGAAPASSMVPAVSCHDLYMNYGRQYAINGLNLELFPGRIVGLMGENGCGKTTLLKILAGVTQDYSGDVKVLGQTPNWQTKAQVSFLPDNLYFNKYVKVGQAIDLFHQFYTDFDPVKATEFLHYFKLTKDMKISNMSKGMIEKLQVGLVMSRQARIYLLDEPLSGVDPAARYLILNNIVKNFHEDALMLMSTHLVHDIEPFIDQAIFMRGGRIIFNATADDIRQYDGMSIEEKFRDIYLREGGMNDVR